jgi:hypothetical protein
MAANTETSTKKKIWTAPTVRLLGTIRELVQGGGKKASTLDGDPTGGKKSGIG